MPRSSSVIYTPVGTLVTLLSRIIFISVRDNDYLYIGASGVGHGSGPRSFVKVKSNQASGIGSTKKNGRIWNFPRKRPPLVDADRAKNRGPQCTSIFVLPFPSFHSPFSLILSSFLLHVKSLSFWPSWPYRYFGLRFFLLETQDSLRYEWIRTWPSLIKLSSYCPPQRCSTHSKSSPHVWANIVSMRLESNCP